MSNQKFEPYKNYSSENVVVDAGIILIDLDEDALVSSGLVAATENSKFLGALRGETTFTLEREVRQIERNGAKGRTRGWDRVVSVSASVSGTFLQFTEENILRAIPGSDSEIAGDWKKITGGDISDDSYFDNVAIVGTLKGSGKEVVIVIKNALADSSSSFALADGNELGVPFTFHGSFPENDPRNEGGLWTIYVPKETESGQQGTGD